MLLTFDGISDFDALHSRRHDELVQLYAFDILVLDGEDLRGLALSVRKTHLARLLARCAEGIFIAPFEQGEIGPDLFTAACNMGLEGVVSKRVDRPSPRPMERLDQGQEPRASGLSAGAGSVLEECTHKSALCKRSMCASPG